MTKERRKRTKRARLRYVLVFLAGAVVGCAAVYLVQTYRYRTGTFLADRRDYTKPKASRESKWAARLEVAGVPSCYKVSDGLYRGAQPSAEGMLELKKLGIRTVVNLRSLHSDRDEIGDTGLAYEHIQMKPWNPDDKAVIRFVKIAADQNSTPVFVHCQRGADRTGMMCAVYRVAVQGWSRDEAVREMTEGGFGFYAGWQGLVEYILKFDIEEVKAQAGLKR